MNHNNNRDMKGLNTRRALLVMLGLLEAVAWLGIGGLQLAGAQGGNPLGYVLGPWNIIAAITGLLAILVAKPEEPESFKQISDAAARNMFFLIVQAGVAVASGGDVGKAFLVVFAVVFVLSGIVGGLADSCYQRAKQAQASSGDPSQVSSENNVPVITRVAYPQAYLVGARSGRRIALDRETTLGRDPANKIALASEYVSRCHAKIAQNGPAYVVRDMNSKSGTRVNGEKVQMRTLKHGDRIRLADQEFVFVNS